MQHAVLTSHGPGHFSSKTSVMKLIICLTFAFLSLAPAQAQESPFAPYLGQWVGVLQYLDYQSYDTVSISVEVSVKSIADRPNEVQLFFNYPKEPGHEHTDTLAYDGALITDPKKGLEWKTAETGRDAGKSGILLHGYRFMRGSLRIWKEVQFDNKPGFFLRNQYLLKPAPL
jgi:hypothetical protein